MNRIKINRVDHGVTIVYNDIFENDEISWTARGLYVFIVSKQRCYWDELIVYQGTPQRELKKAISELIEFGYIREVDGAYELNV